MSFVDPLWEFVLDDYEDENASLFSKFSRKKKKKYKNDEKSVGSRSFLSKRKETRAEYRDDIPEEQDGFWDVISGKPPAAARMRRSRSFDGRTSSRGRDNTMSKNNKTRSSSLTRSQSSVSEADTNEKKKRMFSKKRFTWNQNQKSPDNSSLREYAAPNARNVKHASLADDRYDSKAGPDGTFDPMDLLFQIADKIDPWAYDSDASFSDDESYTDDEGDRYSHVTSNVGSDTNLSDTQRSRSISRSSRNSKTKKLSSLLDPPKEPKKEENSMTEIRLRVNPVGNTLSEEVFEKKTNAFGEQEDDLRKVPSDEEKYNMFATSFDSDTFQKTLQITGESNPPMDFETREQREQRENRELFMNERRMSENEERRPPATARRTDLRSKPSIRDDISKDSASAKSSGLKKAMCGRKKIDEEDTTASRSKKMDPAEAFPASRMVIDGESHLIAESDTASAIIGPMAGSKGPQPVFAYDYDSNMNMDVIYVKPNHKPRTSISVRKLGTPPPISSVLGADHIVIQVEVRQSSHLSSDNSLKYTS